MIKIICNEQDSFETVELEEFSVEACLEHAEFVKVDDMSSASITIGTYGDELVVVSFFTSEGERTSYIAHSSHFKGCAPKQTS